MTADVLALSDERDVQLDLRCRAYTDGWDTGYMAGIDAGRQAEAAERDREWNRIARPISRGVPLTELERKRWTVRDERRTRETFGQPHPGDYLGRSGTA